MASSLSFASGKSTTIGIIATNVKLTKAQAAKVAGMAHAEAKSKNMRLEPG